MSKKSKPGKTTVELQPSRIRRDPAQAAKSADADKSLQLRTGEREIWLAILGIVLFALAINALVLGISAMMA